MRKRDPGGGPAGRRLRLFLAEDAGSVRAQLGAWAGDARDAMSIENFVCARALLRRVEYDPPDLALVDLTLPGLDGLTALRALRAAGVQVALLSPVTADGARGALEGLLEGAADCFWKRGSGPSEHLASSRTHFLERVRRIAESPASETSDPFVHRIAAVAKGDRAPDGERAWLGLTVMRTYSLGPMLHWFARATITPPAGMLIGAPMPRRVTHVLSDCAARLWHRPVLELVEGEVLRPGPWRIVPEGALAAPVHASQGWTWHLGRARGPESNAWVARQVDSLRRAPFDEVRLFLFDDPIGLALEEPAPQPDRRQDRAAPDTFREVEAA